MGVLNSHTFYSLIEGELIHLSNIDIRLYRSRISKRVGMIRHFVKILLLLLLFCLQMSGQNYRYISTADGLSNRRVYSITQDSTGYIWFMTHSGIDRYDGRRFKHFPNPGNNNNLDFYANTDYLTTDQSGRVYYLSEDGYIFKYSRCKEVFEKLVSPDLIREKTGISPHIYNVYFDGRSRIWMSGVSKHYIYDTSTGELKVLGGAYIDNVTAMCHLDKDTYCICVPNMVYKVQLKENNELRILERRSLEKYGVNPNCVYYHKESDVLIIGTRKQGLCFYYPANDSVSLSNITNGDIRIMQLSKYDDSTILVATDAVGVYAVNTNDMSCYPYTVADYMSQNKLNSNIINDIFVDRDKRIWIANFPNGVTLLDNRLPGFDWIKHYTGNRNTLANNTVNRIIEDSDGDIWFATNNGISVYNRAYKTWRTALSSFNLSTNSENHVFMALCEVSPGEIWVAGYSSGMYVIDKATMKSRRINQMEYKGDIRSDKYVSAIFTSGGKYVWSGGYYNLKRYDKNSKNFRVCPQIDEVNCIIKYDDKSILVGSNEGLFIVNEETFTVRDVHIEGLNSAILSMVKKNEKIYIGTENNGLVIYDINDFSVKEYNKNNSSFLTDNIYTILDSGDGVLLMTTDNGIAKFNIYTGETHNWTKELGLISDNFNISSGTITWDGKAWFGSTDGVIAFNSDVTIPDFKASPLVFEDFRIDDQHASANELCEMSGKSINNTDRVVLSYDQNFFSVYVSTVDFDSPSNTYFKWQLQGYETAWKAFPRGLKLQYSNVPPGKYRLVVRSYLISSRIMQEERSIEIIIEPPYWQTPWAYVLYLIIAVLVFYTLIRIYWLQKEKKETRDKIDFYTNTAHDIRTPLTLVKTPIDDILNSDNVDDSVKDKLKVASKGVNSLLNIVSNLIDFEKEYHYSELDLSKCNIDSFVYSIVGQFISYAAKHKINIDFKSQTAGLYAYIDKAKVESMIKNIIGNSVKYTPDGGNIVVSIFTDKKFWNISIRDNGIGIAKDELKHLFSKYFRGSNAVNAKITGSGVGLLYVKTLVKKHKGRIKVESVLNEGTEFVLSLPLEIKGNKAEFIGPDTEISEGLVPVVEKTGEDSSRKSPNKGAGKILVVEDNDQLRDYIITTFSGQYSVVGAENGRIAMDMIDEVNPDLIISDVMMPEMSGIELCKMIKSNINTSHIPVILLTALADNDNIIQGLTTGADEYVTKPFDINILSLTIKNLLRTRQSFRKFINSVSVNESNKENIDNEENAAKITPIDRIFISQVNDSIFKNMDNSEYTVDTLCAEIGMSRTSFYNKLKALTGESPQDYVRNIRLNHAVSLLKKGENNISEIAYMTGFRDAKYFREVFKKYYGVAPSQYLKDE